MNKIKKLIKKNEALKLHKKDCESLLKMLNREIKLTNEELKEHGIRI